MTELGEINRISVMTYLSDFDKDFKGRKFKTGTGTEYTIVGYGDNGDNGNPFLIGMSNGDNKRVVLRTERFKDIELVP